MLSFQQFLVIPTPTLALFPIGTPAQILVNGYLLTSQLSALSFRDLGGSSNTNIT
jgi:hypothetical protein